MSAAGPSRGAQGTPPGGSAAARAASEGGLAGRLAGRVALVTGAGSGFGQGIAERFAREGAAVTVNDLDGAAARRVADAIAATGGRASAIAGDVSRDADVAAMVKHALDAFDDLHVVVNNAGTTHRNQPMLDVSEDEFDRIYAVNVKSLYLTAKHAVPHFRRKRDGVFITIASTAGVRPRPGLTWYNGSKGAAIVTSRSMAAELAPDNIRVNVINPVAGETAMLARFMGEDTPERRAKFVSTIPLGRFSQPSDIATAAVFFASEEAAFVTGACLEVDGGRCI